MPLTPAPSRAGERGACHLPIRRRRLIIVPLLLMLAPTGLAPAGIAAAASDTIASLTVETTVPRTVAGAASSEVRLTLARSARVTVTIRRVDGTLVRTLARDVQRAGGTHSWSWDGRNGSGSLVANGPYRARVTATNGLGTSSARHRFLHGLPAIFPANPGAIVVSIDPGHGGIHWGAYYRGSYEKNFNLDIAFRLRGLLQAAGVRVVLTRTTDSVVNVDNADVNGDGRLTKADDLAARLDIANGARSDIHVSIHNNSAGCRCYRGTEVFTSMKRSWTPEGVDAATMIHRRQLEALEQFRSSTYRPIDRGVKSGSYYMMSPYDEGFRPRPAQMPVVLTESLFVNNDVELGLLNRAAVRQALATAFYRGIADYINRRDVAARYRLVDEPPTVADRGATVPYSVRITNTGTTPSAGWVLELRTAPRVPLYDGSEAAGTLVASRAVPNGLAPGQSVELQLNAAAPKAAGQWLVKVGVRVPGRDRPALIQRGVPLLQVPLRTR